MMTQEQKFIVRELNSYNYLIQKLADMTEDYSKSLSRIEHDIYEIDMKLNEYHIPSVKYDSVSVNKVQTSKNNRIIELISEQEILEKRISEIILIQENEVNKITSRLDDIETMLSKLNMWERKFVTHLYIDDRDKIFMCKEYNYSRTRIYNIGISLLNKMIKK